MLNNNFILALFVFMTSCFVSDPPKYTVPFHIYYAPLLYMRNVD